MQGTIYARAHRDCHGGKCVEGKARSDPPGLDRNLSFGQRVPERRFGRQIARREIRHDRADERQGRGAAVPKNPRRNAQWPLDAAAARGDGRRDVRDLLGRHGPARSSRRRTGRGQSRRRK